MGVILNPGGLAQGSCGNLGASTIEPHPYDDSSTEDPHPCGHLFRWPGASADLRMTLKKNIIMI
jgi:hypothetical protein